MVINITCDCPKLLVTTSFPALVLNLINASSLVISKLCLIQNQQ